MQLSSNIKMLIPSRGRGIRAFTMIEVALSLAVVAFALVAIIGILPTGMTVQKDNREDTLMNQEGRVWIEALKNGARGLDYITNYVEEIHLRPTNSPFPEVLYDNTKAPHLTAPEVITLLSVPKFDFIGTNRFTNRITARVRPITGPATEQSALTNKSSIFRYQLQTEIVPYYPVPRELIRAQLQAAETNQSPLRFYNEAVGSNLWDVRVTLRWPVVERGANDWFVGNNRKTFRAQVSGVVGIYTNNNLQIERDRLAILVPNRFDISAGATPEN